MKSIMLLLLNIGLLNSAFSQTDFRKGYVITNEGDTLTGMVNYKVGANAYQSCDFQKANSNEAVRYGADEIAGYGFLNDKIFKSKEMAAKDQPSKTVFMEVLVSGNVSLYKWETSSNWQGAYFAEKAGDVLRPLTNESIVTTVDGRTMSRYSRQYIGILNSLLFDCQPLKKRIQNVEFNEKSLTNLVQDYNQCQGTPSVSPKSDKPWAKASLGFVGGINVSQLEFSFYSPFLPIFNGNFETSRSLLLGASVDIFSPRKNGLVSFHADILYAAPNYNQTTSTSNSTTIDNFNIALQQLKVPVGIRYLFRERGFAPYINVGLHFAFNLNSTSTWTREVNGAVIKTSSSDLPINKTLFGYWLGLGAVQPISNRLSGFIEFRYERTNGFSDIDFNSRVMSVQIMCGVKFR